VTLILLFFMPVSCPQLSRPSGTCESGVIFVVVMAAPIHWAYRSVRLEYRMEMGVLTVSFICVHVLIISVLSLLSFPCNLFQKKPCTVLSGSVLELGQKLKVQT